MTPHTATISFRGKVETVWNGDVKEQWLKIPTLKRSHCDMRAFRAHPKYGAYVNSDLFLGILRRIKAEVFGTSEYIRLHALPTGVTVSTSEFLATVSFAV